MQYAYMTVQQACGPHLWWSSDEQGPGSTVIRTEAVTLKGAHYGELRHPMRHPLHAVRVRRPSMMGQLDILIGCMLLNQLVCE